MENKTSAVHIARLPESSNCGRPGSFSRYKTILHENVHENDTVRDEPASNRLTPLDAAGATVLRPEAWTSRLRALRDSSSYEFLDCVVSVFALLCWNHCQTQISCCVTVPLTLAIVSIRLSSRSSDVHS